MTQPPSPLTLLLSRHTRRREFIAALGGAAIWPLAAHAQQPKIPKVGFLYPGPSAAATARIDAFLGGLHAAGYRVPEDAEFISRFADGDPTRLASTAIELIDQNVDVIAAVSTAAALAVRAATAAMACCGIRS
jgi:putative tryptophan/tyrosine transport system substrate-binding protein